MKARIPWSWITVVAALMLGGNVHTFAAPTFHCVLLPGSQWVDDCGICPRS